MTGLRIDHAGVVVPDLDAALSSFRSVLDIPETDVAVVAARDPETAETIDIGFVRVGDQRIEFLCPRPGSTSRMAAHLAAHGPSLFHFSVYVDDFEAFVASRAGQGIPLEILTVDMDNPDAAHDADAPAKRRVRIAWVPVAATAGIQVEFVEANPCAAVDVTTARPHTATAARR